MEKIKAFLKGIENYKVGLTMIGSFVVAICIAGWTLYGHFSKKMVTDHGKSSTLITHPPSIKINGDISQSDLSINKTVNHNTHLTKEQLEYLRKSLASESNLSTSRQAKVIDNLLKEVNEKKLDITKLEQLAKEQAKRIDHLLTDDNISEEVKQLIKNGENDKAEKLTDHYYETFLKDKKEKLAYKLYERSLIKSINLKFHEAFIAIEEALNLASENISFNNEAGLLAYKLGDYDKSIEYYEIVVKLFENKPSIIKFTDEDHSLLSATLGNLSLAWDKTGDKERTFYYLEQSLIHLKKISSENLIATAALENNLGKFLSSINENNMAVFYFEQALEKTIKHSKTNTLLSAKINNNIGASLQNIGKFNEAMSHYERALEIHLKLNDLDHPSASALYNNLGFLWEAKSEIDKAIMYYKKALSLKIKFLGRNHPEVATILNNIGFAFHKKGEFDIAINFYEEAIENSLKSIGRNHHKVRNRIYNLGKAWEDKGDYDKAIQFYKEANQITINLFGEHTSEVVNTKIHIEKLKK